MGGSESKDWACNAIQRFGLGIVRDSISANLR